MAFTVRAHVSIGYTDYKFPHYYTCLQYSRTHSKLTKLCFTSKVHFMQSQIHNKSLAIILISRTNCPFKQCLLVYKAMNGPAPSYMKELCMPVTTVATHVALCSAARGDLLVPRTRRQLCNQAFSVAAWNSLPRDIRTAPTISTFKNLLKTHLFSLSYNC